jgi:hypothetical protein
MDFEQKLKDAAICLGLFFVFLVIVGWFWCPVYADQRQGYLFPVVEPIFFKGKIVCTSWYSKMRTENGRTYQYRALNYPCKYGTLIVAPADGVVTYTQIDGYDGCLIELRLDDGKKMRISHLSKLLVLDTPVIVYDRKGKGIIVDATRVKRGQPIGRAGKSGRTTGVHVRIQLLDNNDVPIFCNAETWGMVYSAFEYVAKEFDVGRTRLYL